MLLGPVEVALRGGWQRRGAYSHSPPVYAKLGVGFRWGEWPVVLARSGGC